MTLVKPGSACVTLAVQNTLGKSVHRHKLPSDVCVTGCIVAWADDSAPSGPVPPPMAMAYRCGLSTGELRASESARHLA